jgi:lysophospholipase L1-like esterase
MNLGFRLFDFLKTTLMLCLGVALFAVGSLVFLEPAKSDVVIQNGQKVVFLGDSITGFGWAKPAGYVKLVVAGLAANGVTINPIPAGVGGNTSADMIARLNADVVSKQPDWALVSCGVNDAFPSRNISVSAYESNITQIVDQCQAAHIKVVIMTPTPIGEDWSSDLNVRLGVFNDFLRQLAAQKGCVLADVNAAMVDAIKKKAKPAYTFTVDSVHMDPGGDFVMAACVLRSFGVTDAGIKTAESQWMDIPDGVSLAVTVPMTPRQWFMLQDIAASRNQDVPTYLADQSKSAIPAASVSK